MGDFGHLIFVGLRKPTHGRLDGPGKDKRQMSWAPHAIGLTILYKQETKAERCVLLSILALKRSSKDGWIEEVTTQLPM